MTIHVTQDHIDAALFLRENPHSALSLSETCPASLALKSQGFPDAQIDFGSGQPKTSLQQGEYLWRWIFETIEPFTFEVL